MKLGCLEIWINVSSMSSRVSPLAGVIASFAGLAFSSISDTIGVEGPGVPGTGVPGLGEEDKPLC